MRYRSTRAPADALEGVTFSQAVERGLAADGGLYVPECLPQIETARFDPAQELAAVGSNLLAPFLIGDGLQDDLADICAEALDFPVPVTHLEDEVWILELFHGPTAAFKDVGARFLAACMTRLPADAGRRTVLVATSGDTGGAVAAAFHRQPGIEVVVLFPSGRVSPRQQQQLTCWGDNVQALAVQGSFDDCQRMVKAAFAEETLRRSLGLTSANSINIGRLLPQMVYYVRASLLVEQRTGQAPSFIVPSGNLGNVTACMLVREMGFPIDRIVLATNENRTVLEFYETGQWFPRRSQQTLATAMDVGDPSNMERVRWLYPGWEGLRDAVEVVLVQDEDIRARIREGEARWQRAWCPHTATALQALSRMREQRRTESPWVLVATAHAAKFDSVVEPLVGRPVSMPPALVRLMEKPASFETLAPDAMALSAYLRGRLHDA